MGREYFLEDPVNPAGGKMITLQGFLKMIIGPSFTWVHIMDPLTYKELSRGYVDDLLKEHTQFIQKFEVVSFYTVREILYINVRRIKDR